jgi:hypothetical protein
VKSMTGNSSIKGIAIVVYEMKADGTMGEAVASGQTDTRGDYRIKVSSLTPGTYIVKVQAPKTGGLQGGMTRTDLRGPMASKHISWTLSSQAPAQPSVRWTKVQQVPAGSSGGNE